jgi:histone-lysine N-methyltransferase SETD3
MFIPRSHMITLELAKSIEISQKLIKNKVELLSPKHSFLSIFLLKEKKNPDSFWMPYINILPSDYNNFPIFFEDDDLKWLEGSPFLS